MKTLQLTITAASLAVVMNASAAFTSINFTQYALENHFTTSSLQFGGDGHTSIANGAFSALGASFASMTTDTTLITGLNTTLQPHVISDFLVLSGGTSPADRFHFDLATLEEVVTLSPTTGELVSLYYYGEGTLRDLGGSFLPSPASVGISVVVQNAVPTSAFNAVLTSDLIPVPEPATVLAGALMLVPVGVSSLRILRRRHASF